MLKTASWVLFGMLVARSMLAQPVPWETVYYYPNLAYRAIDCANRLNCGAVGSQGRRESFLVITTDGGATWNPKIIKGSSPEWPLPPAPNDVASPSPNTYAIAADSGVMWITHDRGESFRETRLPADDKILFVEMWDDMRGVAGLHLSRLFVTDDGWVTVRRLPVPDSLNAMIVLDIDAFGADTLLILAGLRADHSVRLLQTVSSGLVWTIRDAPPDAEDLSVTASGFMAVAGDRTVDTLTGGGNSVVSISTDFGETWRTTLDTLFWSGLGVTGIAMADERFGVTFGAVRQIWSTYDGGRTWAADTISGLSGQEQSFRGVVSFPDGSALAAMGANVIAARPPVLGNAGDERDRRDAAVPQIRFDPASMRYRVSVVGWQPDDEGGPRVFNVLGQIASVTITRADEAGRTVWVVDCKSLAPGPYVLTIPGADRAATILVPSNR